MNESPPIRPAERETIDAPMGPLTPKAPETPPLTSLPLTSPRTKRDEAAAPPRPPASDKAPETERPSPRVGAGAAALSPAAAAAPLVAEAPPAVAEAPPIAASDPVAGAADAVAPTAPAAEPTPAEHGIGILLVNLGTPDAAEPAAVRRYLKEFLTDRRVIENDSLLWKMALNLVILPLRSRRRARDYKTIWNNERDESPFKTITRAQAEKLAGTVESLGPRIYVDWAMRYASPPIGTRLDALLGRGCDRVLIMPLYPQYAAATTATVNDEVFKYMTSLRRQPALRIMPAYYDDACYIEAIASALSAGLKALPFEPELILASYHGMPRIYVTKGDPYESHCARTTELLRARLGLDESKLVMTFQSRFGRGKWLEPYTVKTVKALAKKGVKNLVVTTPGFAADCLETLEEIAVENARVFKRYGGQNFAVVPCLNDSEVGMQMLSELAMRELKGWI